jgi:plasmid maintenance system antidote protein VapI|uniref:Helix-turn-helix domain protein n=1 Tax=Myoviridae sp. ct2cn10 TaxID=2825022 RepID=A0A8S5PCI9_9CAUD|nr:helix-turn-helix transcriptional regulator [uncultured Lachnoclostridium sp.]DAE03932.1 MAG TPA: helix-turn-helix domain protein [Myoviridae sp. ct2cn10]
MRIDRVKFVAELTRQDMTQTKLAELSGVSRATINYIKGGKSCSDEVGNKLAKALGVDVSKLI